MEERREELLRIFKEVRQASIAMCEPLQPEDFQVQPVEEVSPPKWNLGHTSWFFWHFILKECGLGLPVDEQYQYFLNSYYYRAGERVERGKRGLVTRPTLSEIASYRRGIDERMERFLSTASDEELERFAFIVRVGVNHEQQHQELFYTEIKSIYYANPKHLRPSYRPLTERPAAARDMRASTFIPFEEGLYEFGNVEGGWCWDNELCIHKSYLNDFALQDRLVTNREYLEFMQDGGYDNPLLWLSDGWATVQREGWNAPLYWEPLDGQWGLFTLSGLREVAPDEPVCHVSFHEAFAFARWKSETDAACKGVRLPGEREWEHAARQSGVSAAEGNFVDDGLLHPAPLSTQSQARIEQMAGSVWEWTLSHYEPFPGFKEFPGNLSEYNGKFMNNQRVLRGGSCVTPRNHFRISYRNFWPPATRFQFTGIRLAKDPE